MSCLNGDYNPVIQNFREIAKGCIEDGAEAIIIGCGLVSPMLSTSGIRYVEEVPVVDPILVGIKMAEILVDFQKADSHN
jgi:Asp/Glu/hydantoin racemase